MLIQLQIKKASLRPASFKQDQQVQAFLIPGSTRHRFPSKYLGRTNQQ